ncbi:MAG: UDP-N-acetylmuramoyl-L-alanyl-D-glutamate--2,6-diaminopimelate ligase, partial [Desulfatitalea sp.]|nr:UDP-N-acetylmuramoyl-L-alanyl-D-glutamate--2,6-diaminopimelate ligase [Desulfatitalea sp.]NNK01091.1 UDP-N-acetylmuramoyl-L-alanyl-D-glutamate--2,6-diaminopimelate ligase [Desulfatitalea sp.]
VIITSDNPRTEAPEKIIGQIETGVQAQGYRCLETGEAAAGNDTPGYLVEPDRRKAIALGIRTALAGDTVLIAGKGHETYQIIGERKVTFDDRRETRAALDLVNG